MGHITFSDGIKASLERIQVFLKTYVITFFGGGTTLMPNQSPKYKYFLDANVYLPNFKLYLIIWKWNGQEFEIMLRNGKWSESVIWYYVEEGKMVKNFEEIMSDNNLQVKIYGNSGGLL